LYFAPFVIERPRLQLDFEGFIPVQERSHRIDAWWRTNSCRECKTYVSGADHGDKTFIEQITL
jgi:hypothetical protein